MALQGSLKVKIYPQNTVCILNKLPQKKEICVPKFSIFSSNRIKCVTPKIRHNFMKLLLGQYERQQLSVDIFLVHPLKTPEPSHRLRRKKKLKISGSERIESSNFGFV